MFGRGRSSKPPSRTVRSTGRSSTEQNGDHGEGKEEVKKPDIDELRQRRAAYFGRAVAERQKVVRGKASTATSTATKSRTTTEHRRKKKSPSTSVHRDGSSKAVKSSKDSDRRSADYVYGPRSTAQASDVEAGPSTASHESKAERIAAPERRRRSNHDASLKRELTTVVEAELTPDDSISVVAERRTPTSHRTRPSSKRSSTTSSKLQPVDEQPEGTPGDSRSSSRREPTLLKSLLRRKTATPSVPPPPRLVECLTCGSDDVPHGHAAKLLCGHRMCHDCLKRIFEMSVKDPAHMPPRCCTEDHIPLRHVDKLFDVKFKLLWNRKYEEYNTRNRIYCPAPSCGNWIKPSHIHQDSHGRKYAHCTRCKTKVCTLCNGKMHKSQDCPQDPEIAKLVDQAKAEGWQRCFNCRSLVERTEGCNHIVCRCLAEFCIKCGAKWKTCECPWFNNTTLPNPDRLNDMMVPQPVMVMYQRLFAAEANQAPLPPAAEQQPRRGAERREVATYQQELDQRRLQEHQDADLARRMQLASLWEPEDEPPAHQRAHHRARADTFGLDNAAGHFLNDDFVQNAANVVMNAFGDANMGRRGERESGRRRRARQSQPQGDTGLAPNFLGDASVLGIGPSSRPARA
ncbi:hypothetical protein LTR08_008735 [Meristemomyces frigidus]|nr:hypothetical protein LTR08_008735 [Meristemomyces frigidus]